MEVNNNNGNGNGNHSNALNIRTTNNQRRKYSGWDPRAEYIVDNQPANMSLRNYEQGLQKVCLEAVNGLADDKQVLENAVASQRAKEKLFTDKIKELEEIIKPYTQTKNNLDKNERAITGILTDPNGVLDINITQMKDSFFSLPLKRVPSEQETVKYVRALFEDKKIFKLADKTDGKYSIKSPEWAEKVCHLEKLNLITPRSAINSTTVIYTFKDEKYVYNTVKYMMTLKNAYETLISFENNLSSKRLKDNGFFNKLKDEIDNMAVFFKTHYDLSRNDQRELQYYEAILSFIKPMKEYFDQIKNVERNSLEAKKMHKAVKEITISFDPLKYDQHGKVAQLQQDIIDEYYKLSLNDFKKTLLSLYQPTEETVDLMDFLYGKDENSSGTIYGVPVKNIQSVMKLLYKGQKSFSTADSRSQKWFGVSGFGCDYIPRESQQRTLLRTIANEEAPLHIGLYTFCMYVRFINSALSKVSEFTKTEEPGKESVHLYNFFEKFFLSVKHDIEVSQPKDDVRTVTQLSLLSDFVKKCKEGFGNIKSIPVLPLKAGIVDDFGGKYSYEQLDKYRKSKKEDVDASEKKLKSFESIESKLLGISNRITEKENSRAYKSTNPEYLKLQVGYIVNTKLDANGLTDPSPEAIDYIISVLTPGLKDGLINVNLIDKVTKMHQLVNEFDVHQAAANYKASIVQLSNPNSSKEYQELIGGVKKYEEFNEKEQDTIKKTVEKLHSLEQQNEMFRQGKLPFYVLSEDLKKQILKMFLDAQMTGQTAIGNLIPFDEITKYLQESVKVNAPSTYQDYAEALEKGKKFANFSVEEQEQIRQSIQEQFNTEMQVTMFEAVKLEFDMLGKEAQFKIVDNFMNGARSGNSISTRIPSIALREYYKQKNAI
ncbi:MAG: hypothetical protein ACK4NC_03520 [Candidatus Gracilibacteria bacterium]